MASTTTTSTYGIRTEEDIFQDKELMENEVDDSVKKVFANVAQRKATKLIKACDKGDKIVLVADATLFMVDMCITISSEDNPQTIRDTKTIENIKFIGNSKEAEVTVKTPLEDGYEVGDNFTSATQVQREDLEDYLVEQIDEKKLFMQLPFILLYFSVFVACMVAHEDLRSSSLMQRVLRNMLSGTTYEGIAYTSGHKDIDDIDTKEDVWTFLNEVVIPIYIEKAAPFSDDRYRVLRYNQLVGGVLLQQVRREKKLCSSLDHLKGLGPFPDGGVNPLMGHFECYPWYTSSSDCFGNKTIIGDMDGWCPDSKKGTSWSRRLGDYPDGGGTGGSTMGANDNPTPDEYFSVYFHEYKGQDHAKEILQKMQSEGWIDFHTSWVGVRALLFNPGLSMFVHMTVNIYFPKSGMLKAHLKAQSFHGDLRILPIDLVWVILLLWFTIRTIKDLIIAIRRRAVRDWFKSIWTWVDVFAVLGGFVAMLLVMLLLNMLIDLKDTAGTVRSSEPKKADIEAAADGGLGLKASYETLVQNLHMEAIEVSDYLEITRLLLIWYTLLCALKFLQAFQAQPRLQVVTQTISVAAEDLFHFGIVFVVIFLSFVVAGVFLYGRRMWDYSSPWFSFMTSFRFMLGDYDFGYLVEENPNTSFIYFWFFFFVVICVVLNILMAIIMDTYTEVKGEADASEHVWTQLYGYVRDDIRCASGKLASKKSMLETVRGMDFEDVDAEILKARTGMACTEEQADFIVEATRERENKVAAEGVAMSKAMAAIGWISCKMLNITQSLEKILADEKEENVVAMGQLARIQENIRLDADPDQQAADDKPKQMSVAEGTERVKRIGTRIKKMEEFMDEAVQYASFRGKDVRNRLLIIEDLLRNKRDAAMMQVEKEIWENIPPRLGR